MACDGAMVVNQCAQQLLLLSLFLLLTPGSTAFQPRTCLLMSIAAAAACLLAPAVMLSAADIKHTTFQQHLQQLYHNKAAPQAWHGTIQQSTA